MSFFDYFRKQRKETFKPNASLAKERLQIIVAHERDEREKRPDYLPQLEKELLALIRKYVPIKDDEVKVELDQADGYSVLELNITLPKSEKKAS